LARGRLSMRKVREGLRLYWGQRRSLREVAQSLGMGHTTAGELILRAREAGLSWPLPEGLDDAELERRLYPGNQGRPRTRPEPDWNQVDNELRRHKGVTLELLWLEYKREHPDGYQYSQFCTRFADWRKRLDIVLRRPHRAGERMFVDYAGPKVPIVDRRTRAVQFEASVFVAALGASSYTFSEAHQAADLPNWLNGHVHAFEFFGGVTAAVVPDNPKTGVHRPCWYEPELNPSYADLAAHYGTVILPARPRRPRDKGDVAYCTSCVRLDTTLRSACTATSG
jgi:transposase